MTIEDQLLKEFRKELEKFDRENRYELLLSDGKSLEFLDKFLLSACKKSYNEGVKASKLK